jgi:microcystin degradation protein MlrC
MMRGSQIYMGRTAVLKIRGVHVIVTSRPAQAWDQGMIKCQGLRPLDFDLVVLKSAVHFRGHFTEIASHIVEVCGPGIHSSRLSDFAFERVRTCTLHPLHAS